MARIRSVRPEFWSDGRIAQASYPARLLYIALWNYVDDEGRGRLLWKAIDGFAFPHDHDVDVEQLFFELEKIGRVERYSHDGEQFFWIPTFVEYQKPNRPIASQLPEPTHEPLTEDSLRTHEQLTPVVVGEGSSRGSSSSVEDALFESLYEAWLGKPYEPGAALTKTERAKLNDARKQLDAVGATPRMVRERAVQYRATWPELEFTPHGLVAHWNRMDPGRQSACSHKWALVSAGGEDFERCDRCYVRRNSDED